MKIDGNYNIQINGNNNVINSQNNKKETKEIPPSSKLYRRRDKLLDLLCIFFVFIVIFSLSFFKLKIEIATILIIFIYLSWYFLPLKIDSLHVLVFSDSFIVGDKKVLFENIRYPFCAKGSTFYYKLHNDDVSCSVDFYRENEAEYLDYRVNLFHINKNIKFKQT